MASGTPNLLTQAICKGLIRKLKLDPSQVFPSVLPTLDPGWQGDRQIQVTPGATQPDGAGKGAQTGGADIERQTFTLTMFYRLNLDPHGRSDQILTEGAFGVLDYFEQIKSAFRQTTLGGLSIERLLYEGETATVWEDAASGVVRRTISYSANYGVDITQQSLSAADLS